MKKQLSEIIQLTTTSYLSTIHPQRKSDYENELAYLLNIIVRNTYDTTGVFLCFHAETRKAIPILFLQTICHQLSQKTDGKLFRAVTREGHALSSKLPIKSTYETQRDINENWWSATILQNTCIRNAPWRYDAVYARTSGGAKSLQSDDFTKIVNSIVLRYSSEIEKETALASAVSMVISFCDQKNRDLGCPPIDPTTTFYIPLSVKYQADDFHKRVSTCLQSAKKFRLFSSEEELQDELSNLYNEEVESSRIPSRLIAQQQLRIQNGTALPLKLSNEQIIQYKFIKALIYAALFSSMHTQSPHRSVMKTKFDKAMTAVLCGISNIKKSTEETPFAPNSLLRGEALISTIDHMLDKFLNHELINSQIPSLFYTSSFTYEDSFDESFLKTKSRLKNVNSTLGISNEDMHFLFSIRNKPLSLQTMNSHQKRNLTFIKVAIQENPMALLHASKDIQKKLLRENGMLLQYTCRESGSTNRELIAIACKQTPYAIAFANKEIVKEYVGSQPDLLQYTGDFIDDLDIVKSSFNQDPRSLEFASKHCIIDILKDDGNLLEYAGTLHQNDIDVVTICIEQNPSSLQYASSRLIYHFLKMNYGYFETLDKKFLTENSHFITETDFSGNNNQLKELDVSLGLILQHKPVLLNLLDEKSRNNPALIAIAAQSELTTLVMASNEIKDHILRSFYDLYKPGRFGGTFNRSIFGSALTIKGIIKHVFRNPHSSTAMAVRIILQKLPESTCNNDQSIANNPSN